MSDVHHRWLSKVLLAAALGCALAAAGQLPARAESDGKIDFLKDKLKEQDKEKDKDRDRERDHDRDRERHDRHDDDDDDRATLRLSEGEGEVLLTVLAAPLWVPAMLLDDRPMPPAKPFRFEKFPYSAAGRGYLRMAKLEREPAPPTPPKPPSPPGDLAGPPGKPPAERVETFREVVPEGDYCSFRFNYSFEPDSSDLKGHRGEFILRTASRVNLDFSATDYCEHVDGRDEHLEHLQGHVTYTFAASEKALFAAGVGVRSLRFEDGYTATGPDFRYEAEFFPIKPLHLHFIAEAGTVSGSSASELEARAGILLRNFELFGGYRRFRVAGEHFSGPEVGVGIQF